MLAAQPRLETKPDEAMISQAQLCDVVSCSMYASKLGHCSNGWTAERGIVACNICQALAGSPNVQPQEQKDRAVNRIRISAVVCCQRKCVVASWEGLVAAAPCGCFTRAKFIQYGWRNGCLLQGPSRFWGIIGSGAYEKGFPDMHAWAQTHCETGQGSMRSWQCILYP